MPYLRHFGKFLSDDTPNDGDVTSNQHTLVPSDADQITDGDQKWHAFVVATQSGGVTAPTTDVLIETSFDGGTSWAQIAKATQLTGDGNVSELIELNVLGPRLRARKVLAGATKPNSTAVVYLASNGLHALTDTGA